MNTPNPQQIRATLEQHRQRGRERARQEEAAMDAFAVRAVHSLSEGLLVVLEDPKSADAPRPAPADANDEES